MSMARREPKWRRRSLSWAGHALLTQRQLTLGVEESLEASELFAKCDPGACRL